MPTPMSLLAIHQLPTNGSAAPAATPGPPTLRTSDGDRIRQELEARGIRFERWPARAVTGEATTAEALLALYAEEIARLQSSGAYPTVDAIRLTPDHPDRVALRQKFLSEHTHSEDEVRFFVEGRGLFCLHLGDEVLQVVCERNDLISVPAGTPHWFDMGPEPHFAALRFFDNPEGWVATFTGEAIAERFPLLDELLAPV